MFPELGIESIERARFKLLAYSAPAASALRLRPSTDKMIKLARVVIADYD